MAFHEGVPGRRLQLAIAGELAGRIRSSAEHIHDAAYARALRSLHRAPLRRGCWASTPGTVNQMGIYAARSMRACRLVVDDTRLHTLNWSRQPAMSTSSSTTHQLKESMCRPRRSPATSSPRARPAPTWSEYIIEIPTMAEPRPSSAGAVPSQLQNFRGAVLDSGTVPLRVLDDVVPDRLT